MKKVRTKRVVVELLKIRHIAFSYLEASVGAADGVSLGASDGLSVGAATKASHAHSPSSITSSCDIVP